MPRKKSMGSTAEPVMEMWDCVLWHLAAIQWSMLEALKELGSDDPFIEKLRDAEMGLEWMRELLACPWTVENDQDHKTSVIPAASWRKKIKAWPVDGSGRRIPLLGRNLPPINR